MSNYPRNSERLIAMRRSGHVPELPVLVSMIGPLPEFSNVTLLADPKVDYDWTPVIALDVDLIVDTKVPVTRVLAALAALANKVPRQMVLSYAEGAQVDCGQWRLAGEQTYFDWFPMAVSPRRASPKDHVRAYIEGTQLARRLWEELGRTLPIPFDMEMDRILNRIKEQQCA